METMILPDDKDMLAEIIIEKVEEIKRLNRENKKLRELLRIKEFILNNELDKEEVITKTELAGLVFSSILFESCIDAFNYGRKEKMAESL